MAGRKLPGGMSLMGLGFELSGAVIGLTAVGYWVDRHFGTHPWGLLVGAMIGLAGGMYNMIREALAASRRGAEEPPREAAGSEPLPKSRPPGSRGDSP